MTFKEMMAGVQIVGVIAVGGWLAWDAVNGGAVGASAADIAIKLLWAVGGLIVFNIIGAIVGTILISVVQREELKDEPSDERDLAIEARSLRNGGIATSIAAAVSLVPLAMGVGGNFAVYALFIAPVIGGAVNAAYQLYYYRTS